ncbi:MPU1p [Coprinopsis cinerea okayama7|uniref:MPU1p n=1 Tax=Coprinopsis cinerea (strain Okayama-7 / 130 / ATCC MYA-4618 / FGSC 9003) TaxID=240176 RepID=A8NPQ2_COPC7|nr:MPU1p [Coprinopsis cinerea okayama7\|eukprot:XP_001835372.1 MPU1p [Coprinopsis cinerea okayama7\
MTAITKNLPWFIKDLGVGIIGKECYTSLVEELNVTDVPCLKYSLSKGLGVGIVVGGSIVKVPQILLILSAKSARGLSLPAYILETLSYGITLAYATRNHFPFSTYGENLFLSIQNVIITLLIISYNPAKKNKSNQLLATGLTAAATAYALSAIPASTLTFLQLLTLPLSLLSKLPQITQNYRAQSTGQLSAFAVLSQVAGCLARLFTTSQEVKDPLVAAGFFLALLLNVVLGAQLYMYWGQSEKVLTTGISEKDGGDHLKEHGLGGGPGSTPAKGTSTATTHSATEAIRERRASPPSFSQPSPRLASPAPSPIGLGRVSNPPSRQGTPVGGRKWSRKVD